MGVPLAELYDANELEKIRSCIQALYEGWDAEVPTVTGIEERAPIKQVLQAWPLVDAASSSVSQIIYAALLEVAYNRDVVVPAPSTVSSEEAIELLESFQ